MMFQAIGKNVRTSQEVGIRLKGRSQLWDRADPKSKERVGYI